MTTDTLLALLLRPEMLETGSVTGIVPPVESVFNQTSVHQDQAIQLSEDAGCKLEWRKHNERREFEERWS